MASGPPRKRLRQSILSFASPVSGDAMTVPETSKTTGSFMSPEPGVTVCIDPPKDGNCQFATVAHLLFHHRKLEVSADDVRAAAINYLRGDVCLLLDGTPFNYEQHIVSDQQTKDNYLTKMSRQGTFGDHITLVAIACVYGVEFVVLSTLGEKGTRMISPNVNSCHDNTLVTLLLGHIAEGQGTHYVGLMPTNNETLSSILEKYGSSSDPTPVLTTAVSPTSAVTVSCTVEAHSGSEQSGLLPNDLGQKLDGPKQPVLPSFPKTTFGKQNRSFSPNYYADHPWLEYSVQCDAVFCFACRHFYTDRRFVEQLFTTKGLRDWKKLPEKLSKHSSSQAHISHMQKWRAFQSSYKTGSVAMQMSDAHRAEVEKNRQYVAVICDVVKLLAKLGLPFRGHDERKDSTSKGNFLEVCDFISNYIQGFKEVRQNYFNCTSAEIQNDIINICGTVVRNEIVQAIRQVGFFTVMVDEARSSKTEKVSLCVRYADGLLVKERFVCFVDCSSSCDAEGLTKVIADNIKSLELQGLPIVGQAYDGAAVMSGHVSGVQQRIRLDNPSALYFHCLAHKLNLVLVNACRVNRTAVAFLNTIQQLYVFFANPGSHAIFLNMQTILGLKAREIGQLSDTRWACRWKSVDAVKTNYAAIVKALTELSDPTRTSSAAAAGLNQHIQTAEFVLSLMIFEDFLRMIHVAHKALQGSSITLANAVATVERLKVHFSNRRSYKQFMMLYKQADALCETHGINLLPIPSTTDTALPTLQRTSMARSRRPTNTPLSLRDYLIPSTLGQHEYADEVSGADDSEERKEPMQSPWYKQLYMPLCDSVIGQLEFRFNKEVMTMAKAVDAVLQCDNSGIQPLIDQYADILDIKAQQVQVLSAEMELFSSTKDDVTIDVIQTELTQAAYPHYYRLVQLALTLPVGTATAERSFSAMRRIRNYLRSTMSDERFSSLALLNIESDLTAALVPDDLVRIYADRGRRLKLK